MNNAKQWEEVSIALQNYYRAQRLNCLLCSGFAEVMHHYRSWKSHFGLRVDPRNLVPLCRSCHQAYHQKPTDEMIERIRYHMENKHGKDWEKQLADTERLRGKQTAYDTREFLKEKLKWYKTNTPEY